MTHQISFYGYIAAAAAFFVLSCLLLLVWRHRVQGNFITATCFVTFVWAAVMAYFGVQESVTYSRIFLVEMIHDCMWLIFLSSLLSGAVVVEKNWLARRGGIVLGLSLVALGLLLQLDGLQIRFPNAAIDLLVMGSIATSLYALAGIEQVYRNARPGQRDGLKFLCIGVLGIFVYDLFLYSNAVIFGQIQETAWGVRGFAVSLSVPLIAISISRIPSWKRGIFASRQIVFYGSTLIAAGIYLSLVGLVGYYIQEFGGELGGALQVIFTSAAILALLTLLFSQRLRRKTSVLVAKHFFERKYDYRVEWLRLIDTLTNDDGNLPLKKRALKALAQIVDSPSGFLWMAGDKEITYSIAAGWDAQPVAATIDADDKFTRFLSKTGWVIDVAEVHANSEDYLPLVAEDIPDILADAAFVVPLMHNSELMGFVSLSRREISSRLNFEDHDLLKTAGKQIAGYLAQSEATEKLAESRQFEAYNRFAAFVMHDLKNAIAQQSLVVENAERHKRNPDFIDDAMATIKGSVARMRRVMMHLRQGVIDSPVERVDLVKLLMRVESQCADRTPVPQLNLSVESIQVKANGEKLQSALAHAIRNAQDATDVDGEIEVTMHVRDRVVEVRIRDTGEGMTDEFIGQRLFKPFDSTKGAQGMGIGAYQIRETVRSYGGNVTVNSEFGAGTTLIIELPLLADGAAQ